MKRIRHKPQALVESQHKLTIVEIIVHDVYGEDWYEDTLPNGSQQDDWQSELKSSPHLLVIAIGAARAVVVGKEGISYVGVGIASGWTRYDRQGCEHAAWIPDPAISIDDSPDFVANLKGFKLRSRNHAVFGNDLGESIKD